MSELNVPPALAALAHGRDHIQTSEMARALNRADQTVRKNYSQTGACFGIVPVKVGNRLLWPVSDIANILLGGTSK
jgi:hypothetical protein